MAAPERPQGEGTDPGAARLRAEAADILLQLRDRPDDVACRGARDAFLRRGPAERAAYLQVMRAWDATAPKRRSRLRPALAAAAFLLLAGALAPELWLRMRADHRASGAPLALTLESGDRLHLDAGTALADGTGPDARRIDLLRGAAFFAVEEEARPFEVTAGETTVHVLGTAFEVSRNGPEVAVTVLEGEVRVSRADRSWTLAPLDRLSLGPSGRIALDRLAERAIAAWRQDRLVADDTALAELAAVIDRRLPGRVLLVGSAVEEARVTGSFDLSDPLSALRAAAAAGQARVIAAPPALTLVLAAD
ncbi:MAG: FecR domain-containing protein [Pseudomonadota bacterium]